MTYFSSCAPRRASVSESKSAPSEPARPRRHSAPAACGAAASHAGAGVAFGIANPAEGEGRSNCCTRLPGNLRAAARLSLDVCLRAAVGHGAGLFVGGVFRSAANVGTMFGTIDTSDTVTGILTGLSVLGVGGIAGARAGVLASNRMVGGRWKSFALVLGTAIGGGLPVASAVVAARHTTVGTPEFYKEVGVAINAEAGRMLTQGTRDTFNVLAFAPWIGKFTTLDDWGQDISLADSKRLDLWRLGVGTFIYSGSSMYHLTQLRDILTEVFGFEEGHSLYALFMGSFGTINSSVGNEIFDDFQGALVWAVVAAIRGYSLLYKRDGCCKCPKTPREFCDTLLLVLDHAAMRIAGFAPAEFAITLAQTYPKGSDERLFWLLVGGFFMGLTHMRGDFVRKGREEPPTPQPSPPRHRQPAPPADVELDPEVREIFSSRGATKEEIDAYAAETKKAAQRGRFQEAMGQVNVKADTPPESPRAEMKNIVVRVAREFGATPPVSPRRHAPMDRSSGGEVAIGRDVSLNIHY